LAADVKEAYPEVHVELIEASGGLFEVTVDGDLVFSKKDLGRHAEEGEVLGLIRDHLGC
jgi:selenoprotein W-related protein